MRFENIRTKFNFSLTMNSDMNVFFVTCGSQTPSSNNRYIGTCGMLELQIFLTKIDFAPSLTCSGTKSNPVQTIQISTYQNLSTDIKRRNYESRVLVNIGFQRIIYLSICTRQCI